MMSMCRVVSYIVGRGCLLWPVHSLGKILLAFALLHFVLQGQTCLLLHASLDFLLLHSSPLWWKGHHFLVLVLKGIVDPHRQFNFIFFGISGWRIDLDYCDIEWFAWKQRSFWHFWDWTQVLHFRLLCWLWGVLCFFWRIIAHSIKVMVIWIKFIHSHPY